MTALFVSDLHLHPSRPDVSTRFIGFLTSLGATQTLYILGDLFEAWVGDDHPEPAYLPVKQALRRCTDAGIGIHALHGNRDFLLGERFAEETGCRLIDEPSLISLNGRRTLLMHGDALCTDDQDYQATRERLRSPQWRQQALRLPLEQRLQIADQARAASVQAGLAKDAYLMDVNQQEVQRVLDDHDAELLIHGHTHRPAIHRWERDGRRFQRAVLGDWGQQGGSLLRAGDGRLELLRV